MGWLADQILWFIGSEVVGSKEVMAKMGKGEPQKIIYRKAKPGEATIHEICKFFGMRRFNKTIYRRLKRMIELGYVERPKSGTYRLTPKGKKKRTFINKVNEANIKLSQTKGFSDIMFYRHPEIKALSVHLFTYDPDYIRMITRGLDQYAEKKGKPVSDLGFEGDLELGKELTWLVFNVLSMYFKSQYYHIDDKTKQKIFEIMNSLPFVDLRSDDK